MRFRKLRIAWSVVCLIACVLLIVLWVRSYSNGHLEGYLPAPSTVCCRSMTGVVIALRLPAETVTPSLGRENYQPLTFQPFETGPVDIVPTRSGFIFDWHSSSFWIVQLPYWFLVAIPALCGVAPWLNQFSWRFSLRTLLIATTLVAVVLGLAVWATR
jgi:hypothetical protein